MTFHAERYFALFSPIDWFVFYIGWMYQGWCKDYMNISTVYLRLVFIFRVNIIEHVTRLGAFSKLQHFILKRNLLNYCGPHYYLSQPTECVTCSKYYRILSERCPEELPLVSICKGNFAYSVYGRKWISEYYVDEGKSSNGKIPSLPRSDVMVPVFPKETEIS
jgi:hypothetical protein